MKINENTIVAELVDHRPESLPVFWRCGIYFAGAPYLRSWSIKEVCEIFSYNTEAVVGRLQAALK